MVILHIAKIENEMFKGVDVAVPQHITAQQEIADVALLNLSNVEIPGVKTQLPFKEQVRMEQFQAPYNKPDIVVFHEVYYPPYLKISEELRKSRIPYVIIPHGCLTTEAQRKKWLKKKIGNFLLFNRYIKNAAAIQCLSLNESEKVRFDVKKFIGTNGVTVPERRKDCFHRERVEFLYVGRLDAYHKGLDLLLQAVEKKAGILRKHHCCIKICGPDCDGDFSHVQRLIRENKVMDLVELCPGIYGKDKENALLSADLFVQTSRFEGMPLGILEALSYGLPCLVSRGTTLGERIEENDAGWMAETDADSVAAALERAVSDRARWREMSAHAVEMVKKEFAWDVLSKRAVECYKQIAEGGK